MVTYFRSMLAAWSNSRHSPRSFSRSSGVPSAFFGFICGSVGLTEAVFAEDGLRNPGSMWIEFSTMRYIMGNS